MPSSHPSNLSLIVQIVQSLNPSSILDLGIGTGKYAFLFREYLDGHAQKRGFHKPDTWKVRIDGVEIFEEYIIDIQRYLYDNIYIQDAYDYIMETEQQYDLVFMGDFIEHLEKPQGLKLLAALGNKVLVSGGSVVISTPNFVTGYNDKRLAVYGNTHEVHRCRWFVKDFEIPGFTVNAVESKLLTVTMTKDS